MSAASRIAIALLFLFSFSTSLTAGQQADAVGPRPSPVITATTAGENLRFIAPASVCQIRVQILSPTGEALFDSAWRDGNVLDWPIEAPGQPLTSGSYRCVVTVKDLDGQVAEKEATLIAQGGQVSIERRPGAEALTIVGADENGPKITLLAHDGEKGAVVSTAGDLSFRFGNFLAGKDSERMRLTAEGNLGIGTDKPQAPLDVVGLIRTSKGILFPDGTILTTAEGLPGIGESGGITRQPPSAPGDARVIVRGGIGLRSPLPAVTANRPKPRTESVPDYQFKVDSLGVHIGTTSAFGLDVAGNVNLSSNLMLPSTSSASAGVIRLNGVPFLHGFGNFNAFVGGAGNFTMTGLANTASGYSALSSNGGGYNNTVSGYFALPNNSSGYANTAIGATTLYANGTGYHNTALGYDALHSNTSGVFNIAVGSAAGHDLSTGNYNIDIGNTGVGGESGTIRIGTAGSQTQAFLAGVRGVTTGAANAIAVMIDSNGQLGTISSSRRFKFDIADIGEATDGLMRLRPVTFRYLANGDNAPLQYGLIAEEVAEVYPELVARDKDGQVETVMYQFLAPMLLNEAQKQHRQIDEQKKKIEKQQKTIEALNATLESLGQRLQALERQAALGK